jgi:cell fate (sporulation/competence/biofilm development) regulator YlbF (YheA/YmcA/DUF963 family)
LSGGLSGRVLALTIEGSEQLAAQENNMESTIQESAVILRTKELCQALLEEPTMRSIRKRIDSFMGDEKSRNQYQDLVEKGQALQEKQQSSMPLTGEEIASFEEDRDALLKNPVARDFMDAQEELRQVQKSIHKYVDKTLELGRLPTEEELSEGCCSHGCSCSH